MSNQNPEQEARDAIDRMLTQAGWVVQSKSRVDLSAGQGVAVREYPTDIGPADYVLFVERKPVGVVEAKREEEGRRMTVHEDQAEDYAAATLKHLDNERLPFVYESTGTVTRNHGEQAEQEFMAYRPPDDNRKFTELYNVQRLSSGYIASDSHPWRCCSSCGTCAAKTTSSR